MSTIDAAAYVKLENRVKELEATLGKLKGNLASSQMPGFFPIAPAQVAGVGGLASFDFQNIPATYSKLVIDLYARGDTAATNVAVYMRMNNDLTANLHKYTMALQNSTPGWAPGASAGATSIYTAAVSAANAPAGFDVAVIEIPGYAEANAYKSCISRFSNRAANAVASLYLGSGSGWYDSNNQISRVTLFPGAGNFARYSEARLYGVL